MKTEYHVSIASPGEFARGSSLEETSLRAVHLVTHWMAEPTSPVRAIVDDKGEGQSRKVALAVKKYGPFQVRALRYVL